MRLSFFAAASTVFLISNSAVAASVLHRPLEAEPDSLDPVKTTNAIANSVETDLFEGLVRLDPTGAVVPGVAESWEVAPDGVTYLFHLRANARWSNGDPLTSEDFVYAWRRGVDPATAATSLHALRDVANGEEILAGKTADLTKLGIEGVDPHTLRIITRAPTPLFLAHCALRDAYPTPRAAIDKWGREWTQPGHMVSNGPFTLKSWVPHGEITLTRSETYWDRASIKLDEIDNLSAENEQVALKRFFAGELDYALVPSRDLPRMRAEHADVLHIGLGNRIHSIAFNMKSGPFANNKALRQALALTFDTNTLVTKIQPMGQQVAYNWVPPTVPDHTPQKVFYAKLTPDERVALAKKLYAEAGFGPDHPLKFTVNYPTNEDARTELLAAMQMWKNALGAEMTMESEEFQIYLQRLKRGDDEMTLLGWSEELRDPSLFLDRFVTGAFGNYFEYSNPAVDDLEKSGAATMDPVKRRDIYEKVESLITEDVPGIPSYFNSIVMVVNPRLKGWVDDNQYPQSRWLAFKN